MGLPTEIIKHFDMLQNKPVNGEIRPKCIGDLLLQNPEKYKGVNLMYISAICRKFVNEGLLMHAGTNSYSPPLSECYYSYNINEEYAKYGSYDFLINGFISIRNHFTKSVIPIEVKKKNDDLDIGTGFIIDDNKLITAAHCIKNMKNVIIYGDSNRPLNIDYIFISNDSEQDIACIVFQSKPFVDIPKFMFGSGNILDEVLTMGYPPIAGFDAIQIAEISTINTKSSLGNIIAKENSFLDKQDFILMNARVKGGNSGGPLINKYGLVVGILVQIPYDIENPEKLDVLGYGIAIPTDAIKKLLKHINITKVQCENTEKGFSTLKL